MARHRHHSLLIGIAVLIGVLLTPVGASAATCDARDMLDAAANGRAISQHTPACYKQALAELPSDVDDYLPAVRANLTQAMRRDATLSHRSSSNTAFRTPQGAVSQGVVAAPAVAAGVRGPVTDLLEGLGPAHVDQVPLPVVALGGAAALLLLAGLGTSLARVRSRRRVAG
ncbi:MAG TPA: hypothetical protein VFD90_17125 [Gaiellales bacterium]|jgi:hypothetical protein|nr:hypothetical protein [Gaiellales bacterium]